MMTSARIAKTCLALWLIQGAPCSANDGIAGVGVGGIVFGKTDAIAMKKEVLNVGYDKISVDYDFLNESDADVEETIAFPLPEYAAHYLEMDTYYGQPNDFSIVVDGKTVPFQSVLAAKLDGKDVSAKLRGFGLTDEQIAYYPSFSPFDKKVKPLSARQEKILIENALLAKLADDGSWIPAWTVQIHYVWKQTFPAHQMVHVYHQYRPFVSTNFSSPAADDSFMAPYCADRDFLKAWKRQASQGGAVLENEVSYILKTGNTWKNGIEDFTLNLVKKKPSELVSLCFPGKFTRINPTTLQVHLKNFKPTQDLEVYFGNVNYPSGTPIVRPQLPR
ncbi:hypothetical protein AAKU55_003823 [Oxalobacteraceae bacterium GrIS 1.11]